MSIDTTTIKPVLDEVMLSEAMGLSIAAVRTADHIELVHERELTSLLTSDQIIGMHEQMHAARKDWGHTHHGARR